MRTLLKAILPFVLLTPGCFVTIQERPYFGPHRHFHRHNHYWCDWCGCYHDRPGCR